MKAKAKSQSAAYVLVLLNSKRRAVRVGSLGRLTFEPGFYLYVGSGGRNVLRRVQRHLAPAKRVRWHIDYLTAGRSRMRPVDAYVYPGVPECRLALALGPELSAVPGFGSSDCGCPAHLFHSREIEALSVILNRAAGDSALKRCQPSRCRPRRTRKEPGFAV